jgi:hypothetical protein
VKEYLRIALEIGLVVTKILRDISIMINRLGSLDMREGERVYGPGFRLRVRSVVRQLALAGSITVVLIPLSNNVRAEPSWAKPNRLVLSLGFGVSLGDLEAFHNGANHYLTRLQAINPELGLDGSLDNHLVLGPELSARYYFVNYLWAELGFNYLYNDNSIALQFLERTGSLSVANHVFELPVLVGGYYPIHETICLHAGIGPSLFVYSLSDWNYSHGEVTHYATSLGGGFRVRVGADWLFTEVWGVGLCLCYRNMKSSELEATSLRYPPVADVVELDMSGFGLSLGLAWHVL